MIDIYIAPDINTPQLVTKEVTDLYEASYYIYSGAKFVSARQRKADYRTTQSKGYRYQWYVTLSDIPEQAIERWKKQKAVCGVAILANTRTKLKRKIKNYLGVN